MSISICDEAVDVAAAEAALPVADMNIDIVDEAMSMVIPLWSIWVLVVTRIAECAEDEARSCSASEFVRVANVRKTNRSQSKYIHAATRRNRGYLTVSPRAYLSRTVSLECYFFTALVSLSS